MRSNRGPVPIPEGTLTPESSENKSSRPESPGARPPAPIGTPSTALSCLHSHWPEYLMEAAEIASYMFCVCTFATLLLHPASPIGHVLHGVLLRRALMGVLVGSAVVAIIMTPWGKQSGGHFNPAMTLAFYRLRKLAFWDAFFYVAAQFAGAAGGVGVAAYVLRDAPKSPSVRYAVTAP